MKFSLALFDKKGRELVGRGYQRALVHMKPKKRGVIVNCYKISFPVATNRWKRVCYFKLMDADGAVWFGGELLMADVETHEQLFFMPGELKIIMEDKLR